MAPVAGRAWRGVVAHRGGVAVAVEFSNDDQVAGELVLYACAFRV
jgi:hypothetical protein